VAVLPRRLQGSGPGGGGEWRKAPESLTEFTEAQAARTIGVGVVPDGAFRNAIEQKETMTALQPKVSGAEGGWQPYGIGPQVQDQAYADGSRDGIPVTAGRVGTDIGVFISTERCVVPADAPGGRSTTIFRKTGPETFMLHYLRRCV